jgi:hypothetical protein
VQPRLRVAHLGRQGHVRRPPGRHFGGQRHNDGLGGPRDGRPGFDRQQRLPVDVLRYVHTAHAEHNAPGVRGLFPLLRQVTA